MSPAVPVKAVAISFCVALASCGIYAEKLPSENQYQSGWFCLDEKRWGEVIAYTQKFGSRFDLKYAGGTDKFEGAGHLNIALLRGGNFFRRGEIAFYVQNNPFEARKAIFSAVTRDRITSGELQLAKNYEAGLRRFSC